MPRGDRTGPNGFGPRTGRGLGYCSGYSTPGYITDNGMGLGRGYGGGRGGGRGYGRGQGYGRGWNAYPPVNYAPNYIAPGPYDEEAYTKNLENQVKYLEDSLNAVKEQLESQKAKKSE